MPLFLVTSLYDEGISLNGFRVVEAGSKQAIAQHMLEHAGHGTISLTLFP
jgi:hypothetical protein